MEIKKNPKVALDNYSKIFYQIGLVLTLFIVYSLLELKSYDREIENLSNVVLAKDIIEETPMLQPKEILPQPPPPQNQIMPQKVIVVDDKQDIKEIVLESTETDETEAVVYTEPEEIVEEVIEEVIEEDVPFMVIEKVPVYPGCTGSRNELKKCFSKSLQKFFQKKFDPSLASELGLPAGKKRIIVLFKINKNGNAVDIQARAPHPRLKKEAIDIVSSLPKMVPGEQRGRKVGVKYTLPVTFLVQ